MMAKYYTVKLTKDQYSHVMQAMNSYFYDVSDYEGEPEITLHKQTEQALMKAQEKPHGKT